MKIYTLTLNPAFDLHYTIDDFKPYSENYVHKSLTQSAGKGINISRGLKSAGIENTAYIIVGKNDFESYIRDLDVGYKYYLTPGDVRKNITVHTKDMPETRISLDDFYVDKAVFENLKNDLYSVCDENTIVTFTGRLPKGIEKQCAVDMLASIKKTGAKIVCDCNSFTFEDLEYIKPWLIKPNETEIKQLYNGDVKIAGEKLQKSGIETVVISMGGEGVLFFYKNGMLKVKPPKIHVISTIGAGDSTIAGFITAFTKGMDVEDCVKYAVASGTAACLEEGTNPPSIERIEEIYRSLNKIN